MRIKVLRDFETPIYNLKAGQVIDVPDAVASKAIDENKAEAVDGVQRAVKDVKAAAAECAERVEALKRRGRPPKQQPEA